MSKGAQLTNETVRHLATLSQLTLTDSESDELTHKLEETVNYIENIAQVDTKGQEGVYHSTDNVNVYRDDTVDKARQFDQKTAVQNAKQTKRGMFVAARVLE